MFTGIITDIGEIISIKKDRDTRFVIKTVYDMDTVDMGASIACNGVCLTVVEKANSVDGNWYAVEASQETLDVTTLSDFTVGSRVNLERAMKLGDEIGGHLVLGHVDTVIPVVDVTPVEDSLCITFNGGDEFSRYIAKKGSVVIDGVSLTVNAVDGTQFSVNIIPHTQDMTTLGVIRAGHRVNLEIDMMARYVARLIGKE